MKRGGSYMDSPDWIESKKAAIKIISIMKINFFNALQQLH